MTAVVAVVAAVAVVALLSTVTLHRRRHSSLLRTGGVQESVRSCGMSGSKPVKDLSLRSMPEEETSVYMAFLLRRRYIMLLVVKDLYMMLQRVHINSGSENPTVEEYYTSLESRLGYWLLLGNARHCGFWETGTIWPFPISKAQRAMEGKLYERMGLQKGSRILDAGAGSGIVAAYMAERDLEVQAIDLTPAHVEQAKYNVARRGLGDRISVKVGDYHDLADFDDSSFDGIYTMETFVHADDPLRVLQNFKRLLKPGGVLMLHEADFYSDSPKLQEVFRLSHCQNTREEGAYERLLEAVGFQNVEVEDLTDNVLPLWRLFGILGAVPYDILRIFGLQNRFTNVMAGVETYRHWGSGRYISVKAVKPLLA